MEPPGRQRVANACDICKTRKVKCDGKQPCSYCIRRDRAATCHFSPQTRRRPQRGPSQRALGQSHERDSSSPRPLTPALESPSAPPQQQHQHHQQQQQRQRLQLHHRPHQKDQSLPHTPEHASSTTPPPRASTAATSTYTHQTDVSAEDEAEVPREGRLLCDAQGKLVFIGDCAPLSFFQSVRQIVTSHVDPMAFKSETSRGGLILENKSDPIGGSHIFFSEKTPEPNIPPDAIEEMVSAYMSVTSGLVDFFDNDRLVQDVSIWATQRHEARDITPAVNYLILAIGCQTNRRDLGHDYFRYGKNLAVATLDGNLSVGTVQAFALITLYMLRVGQINAAFLFFGIATRAAYSIGVHRTELNSRFGPDIHRARDRLWKSLRIVDLFLSISMGRPPATSDVDCTVPYRAVDHEGNESFDLLNSSVQILLITETIVLEVYHRKKISLQLTEGLSRGLRDWSSRWLAALKQIVSPASSPGQDPIKITGACQILCSYYYAVMLVSRPFLMYELHKRMSDHGKVKTPAGCGDTNGSGSGRLRLANACIDAASLLIETVLHLVNERVLDHLMPLIVSWLFSSSLVIGVGLLGDFGRILEKDARMSIDALGYFAQKDNHAIQYRHIANSLLSSSLRFLEEKDARERTHISEGSSQIFGLIPKGSGDSSHGLSASGASQASTLRAGRRSLGGSSYNGSRPLATAPQHHNAAFNPMHEPFDFDNSMLHHSLFSLGDTPSTTVAPTSDGDDATTPTIFSPFSGGPARVGGGGNSNPSLDHRGTADQVFGALNLFPLLDGNGDIDLAHYW